MKTREQLIEAAEVYSRHNLVTLSRELTEFLANFALEQIEEAIAAERSEIERLSAENRTFRNAMKACEDCDAVTVAEVAKLREERLRILQAFAYEEGVYDGLAKAIEVVKGGEDR